MLDLFSQETALRAGAETVLRAGEEGKETALRAGLGLHLRFIPKRSQKHPNGDFAIDLQRACVVK